MAVWNSILYYHSQLLCILDQKLLSSAALSVEKRHIEVKCSADGETREPTSLSQSLKEETRVKTVGFFTSLQVREETKLVTPWTNHLPSWPKQFRGPPESPWRQKKERTLKSHFHYRWLQHFFTHVASRYDVSSRTNHGGLDEGAPPIALAAHAVSHHRQQGLLQLIWHRSVGWGGGQNVTTNMSFMLDSVPTPHIVFFFLSLFG